MAINDFVLYQNTFLSEMISDKSVLPVEKRSCKLVKEMDAYDAYNWNYVNNTLYFHKSAKGLNEFVGEKLASMLGLPSAHYEPVMFSSNLCIRTPDFKEKGYDYLTLGSIKEPIRSLDDLINVLSLDKENVNKILKMFAIDIYMRQLDRSYVNFMFMKDKKTKKYSFGPLFDYTMSFYSPYPKYPNDIMDIPMTYRSVHEKLDSYPEFFDYLDALSTVDLLNIIRSLCDEYSLTLIDKVKDFYSYQQEYSKQLIKEIR